MWGARPRQKEGGRISRAQRTALREQVARQEADERHERAADGEGDRVDAEPRPRFYPVHLARLNLAPRVRDGRTCAKEPENDVHRVCSREGVSGSTSSELRARDAVDFTNVSTAIKDTLSSLFQPLDFASSFLLTNVSHDGEDHDEPRQHEEGHEHDAVTRCDSVPKHTNTQPAR